MQIQSWRLICSILSTRYIVRQLQREKRENLEYCISNGLEFKCLQQVHDIGNY